MAIRENAIHAPPLPKVPAAVTPKSMGIASPAPMGAPKMPQLGGFAKPPKLDSGRM